ncbi:hypothetical protein [Microcoleus sp. FACHB-831]|uniref:hypothetical protein n=1 Tax=Microcoleus sp. FACHB-831 TaxID=2692827 RepID=UPI001686F191|nr:hypothetical protein [Microcoleus sp. FACHB-831]
MLHLRKVNLTHPQFSKLESISVIVGRSLSSKRRIWLQIEGKSGRSTFVSQTETRQPKRSQSCQTGDEIKIGEYLG